MSEILKLKNSQAALVANNTHAGNIALATTVRIYNNAATKGDVTIQTVSDSGTVATGAVVKGMISVGPAETVLLKKDPTDEVFGSAATLLAASVSVEG
tara:strand:- start:1434 stop:1727 length:294 start_codon:yes stop_codon:yes gene_type:complete